ncbi:hypothetical protein MLD52_06430 [Puniceicoccaceae bacterium K14]|nr:hypothetical protein [Puniceicoccaceae bacterium K14]
MRIHNTLHSLALSAFLALSWSNESFASGNPWFDDFVSYDDSRGSLYTATGDAANLAWQESYMLRSYLNLYEASQDTVWLTKFTSHFDTVMGTAYDSDGDGYDDWTTARYSPNPVLNSGFETADSGDSTLPENWIRIGSNSTTAYRTDADGEYREGWACSTTTWGLKITTAGSTLQRLYQDIPSYLPGHRYQLNFYAKKGGSVDGRVFVYDRTTGATLANLWVNSSSWKSYSLEFVMPVAGHDVEVWVSHESTTTSGDEIFYDIIRVAPFYSYHVIDGMITTPVAEFVSLVNKNSFTLSAFQSKADTYQDFLEDEVIAKWEDPSGFYGNTWVDSSATEGYYEEPMNYDTFSSSTVLSPLPHNQYFTLLTVQNILYEVNSISAYRTKADKGGTFFSNLLTTQGTAYNWNYGTHTGAKVEDASHANVDMEFVMSMYLSGNVFSGNDMEAFTDTQTDYLWNGSYTAPEQNNLVNGTQGTYCLNYLFSRPLWGWISYAQFDPLVWSIGAIQYASAVPASHSEAVTLSEIIAWDPVKLTNQGMEYADSVDATLPARWERLLSTSSTAYRDSSNANRGDYGLTLVADGVKWQKLTQDWSGYEASTIYEVTFDAKVDSSGADGRIWIVNNTTSSTIATYNVYGTSWATYSFTFTSPSSTSDDIDIVLGHRDYTVTGGETHFDNVSIKVQGDAW